MRGAERVVFAFLSTGETRKTAGCAKSANAVAAAGKNLVGIRLMTDIPNKPITRCIENVVKGDSKLHHPQAGAEMPSGHSDRRDRFAAKLVGQLPEL